MITLYRVLFGKKDTLKETREYQITRYGPIGTLKEFKIYYPYEKFNIVDHINRDD